MHGEAVVDTRAQLARETRTYDRPDDLANWLEQDGINALLSAAGIDPERIRDGTGSAMRTGGNTPSFWNSIRTGPPGGPYLPKMGEAPG